MSVTRPITQESEATEKKSRLFWSGLIVSLLGLQISGCLLALFLATGSTSMAVVPNYHEKALNWDKQRALQHASDQLGWRHTLEISTPTDLKGMRNIELQLRDEKGAPLTAERITMEGYPHTNPRQVAVIECRLQEVGKYVASVKLPGQGLWQFELHAFRDQDHYVANEALALAPVPNHVTGVE